MADASYRVVFSGKTIPGFDRDTAIRNLAQLLKRTPEQVAGAFAGKDTVIKSGISSAEAEKYCLLLEKAGLMVHAEPVPAAALARSAAAPVSAPAAAPAKPAGSGFSMSLVDDDAPAPPPPPKPAAPPPVAAPKISASLALVDDDEHRDEDVAAGKIAAPPIICPACGFQQPKTEVCASCHVVIAKFLQRKAEKEKLDAERAAKAPKSAPATEPLEEDNSAGKPSLFGKLFGKLKGE